MEYKLNLKEELKIAARESLIEDLIIDINKIIKAPLEPQNNPDKGKITWLASSLPVRVPSNGPKDTNLLKKSVNVNKVIAKILLREFKPIFNRVFERLFKWPVNILSILKPFCYKLIKIINYSIKNLNNFALNNFTKYNSKIEIGTKK